MGGAAKALTQVIGQQLAPHTGGPFTGLIRWHSVRGGYAMCWALTLFLFFVRYGFGWTTPIGLSADVSARGRAACAIGLTAFFRGGMIFTSRPANWRGKPGVLVQQGAALRCC